jgi:hypothetical protein
MKKLSTAEYLTPALWLAIFSLSLALSVAYAADGVDLDISQFRATSKVDLSSRKGAAIQIDLSVKNNGSVAEPRTATLVGRRIPGNSLVFNRRVEVFDEPGGGPSRFTVVPTDFGLIPQAGGIRWEVVIADDDPDNDYATDITTVRP